jgi:hypothetical protein
MEINWILEGCDFIAASGVWLAKWLSARQKRICYIIFSAHAIYWVCRGYGLGLHVAPMLSCVNIALNIYGFMYWGKKAKEKR